MSKIPDVFKLSDDELAVWEGDGIHIKAVTSRGDPVELSETEALELADAPSGWQKVSRSGSSVAHLKIFTSSLDR